MPAVSPIFVFEIHYGLVEGCRVIVSSLFIYIYFYKLFVFGYYIIRDLSFLLI